MKRILCVVGLLCGVVPLSGCEGQKTQRDEASIPIAEFKQSISKAVTEFNQSRGEPATNGYSWYKCRSTIRESELNYDVTKADSLVAPYNGKVTLTVDILTTDNTKTKEEAEAIEDGKWSLLRSTYVRMAYVYRDKKWKLVNIEWALDKKAEDKEWTTPTQKEYKVFEFN